MCQFGHVAREYGYKYQVPSFDPSEVVPCGDTPVRMVLRPQTPGYDPAAAIRETVEEMADGETVVFVCHPGYLDQYINQQLLAPPRIGAKEVDALIDPELRAWLESREDLELIDYRDLWTRMRPRTIGAGAWPSLNGSAFALGAAGRPPAREGGPVFSLGRVSVEWPSGTGMRWGGWRRWPRG